MSSKETDRPENFTYSLKPSRFFPLCSAHNVSKQIDRVNHRIATLEVFVMPGKYSKPSKPKNDWSVEFVALPLMADQKDSFIAWAEEASADVEVFVAQLLGTGYKLSMTLDATNNCVIVTATCKEERSPNSGYAMSSRSDTWLEALLMTVYKTIVLYPEKDGGWPKNTRNDSWG